ncbi:hypothetical protein Taro_056794 [Colocasia esculenta]|uniref:Uncharacterized protein n=1 Tax=Colocasia esculenta TaxID=4460 RepID=A0A843XYG5_COLES|nr:hypothetical protein [Colocasia esculenta]
MVARCYLLPRVRAQPLIAPSLAPLLLLSRSPGSST